MSITEMVDHYRAEGYSDREIDNMIMRDLEEAQARFIEDYENDPIVQEGWHQQDIIDMYRNER